MNKEGYILQVLRVEQKDHHWEIDGLVFDTIKRDDVLFTTENPDPDKVRLRIIDIVLYRHHIDEIDRGLTGTLIVQNDDTIDLAQVKYLYRATPDGLDGFNSSG